MGLQFTPDLSTTVQEIDDQHKELFVRINNLLTALEKGSGKDQLSPVVQFLTDYVVYHFGVEEKYMDKYSYGSATQHKAQHAQFVKTFVRLKDRIFVEGIDKETIEDTRQLVVDWLINHIKYSDKALGMFLKRKL